MKQKPPAVNGPNLAADRRLAGESVRSWDRKRLRAPFPAFILGLA